MTGGVYQIRNTITEERYIGATEDLSRRREQHFKLLRRGRHRTAKLQASFSAHGEAAFVFEVVSESDDFRARDKLESLLIRQSGPFALNGSKRGKPSPWAKRYWELYRLGIRGKAASEVIREESSAAKK